MYQAPAMCQAYSTYQVERDTCVCQKGEAREEEVVTYKRTGPSQIMITAGKKVIRGMF